MVRRKKLLLLLTLLLLLPLLLLLTLLLRPLLLLTLLLLQLLRPLTLLLRPLLLLKKRSNHFFLAIKRPTRVGFFIGCNSVSTGSFCLSHLAPVESELLVRNTYPFHSTP